jgi:hypothetical protein
MELKTEITRKELRFIDSLSLRTILLKRLHELDRVFLVNAHSSILFLSISCIEGILKHVASIFKEEIKRSPEYPEDKGKKKKFNDLTIEDLYTLIRGLGLLPGPSSEHIYKRFRDYRNYIHPQKQLKAEWPIDIGQAQMAVGLLNETITSLSKKIFIEKDTYSVIEGDPDYSEKTLYLKFHQTPLHSLIIYDCPISEKVSISFDLELPRKSILNFVFNYIDEDNFKMIRLDSREFKGYRNSLLYCTQKYFWRAIYYADPDKPQSVEISRIEIVIDFEEKAFTFHVDGRQYIFKDSKNTEIDIYKEISRGKKIGFFNEVGTVRIHNLKISR